MRRIALVVFSLLFVSVSPVFADNTVEKVYLTPVEGGVAVRVKGEFGTPVYRAHSRDGGNVVVLEVAGAHLPQDGLSTKGNVSLVRSVSGSVTAKGVRIEIAMKESQPFRARGNQNEIVVYLGDVKPDAVIRKEGPATVRSIHMEVRDGRERLVIEASKPVAYRIAEHGDSKRLELRKAVLGSAVAEQVGRIQGKVLQRVLVREEGGRVVVEADRNGEGAVTAIREGSRIVWLFAPDRSVGRKSKTVAREDLGLEVSEGTDVAGFLTTLPKQTSGARRYSGRRIDLDFKNADIHDILRLLADVGGVNVVTADNVSGSVTIKMRNVPWDQALDVVLKAKDYGMERRGNLIRVAPNAQLAKEREEAIARAKQREELAPLETRLVPVSYAEADQLSARVKELLSARGSVSVDQRTNMLIVRDIVDNLGDVEALVRSLDTQTPQVLVEARVVEASSNYVRDVGIQWGGGISMGTATGNPTGLAFPNSVGVAGGADDGQGSTAGLSPFTNTIPNPLYAVNLPAAVGAGSGGALGLSLGSIGGNVNLNVRLSAAESNGVVRIISSPRILTLDNNRATISQGTSIPFSQVSAQGVQTAFQEAKLELSVQPHVTSDGSIAMDVSVNRDEPDFSRVGARGEPTILKRNAQTKLLVADGHTAVIGGIYTRNTSRNVSQVPFFGDIPILGLLFQKRQVQDQRSEMLIFLTPRIVNRAASIGG